jgi:hypothetical protein
MNIPMKQGRSLFHFKAFGMIDLHYLIRICKKVYNRGKIIVNVWRLIRNSLHQTLSTLDFAIWPCIWMMAALKMKLSVTQIEFSNTFIDLYQSSFHYLLHLSKVANVELGNPICKNLWGHYVRKCPANWRRQVKSVFLRFLTLLL